MFLVALILIPRFYSSLCSYFSEPEIIVCGFLCIAVGRYLTVVNYSSVSYTFTDSHHTVKSFKMIQLVLSYITICLWLSQHRGNVLLRPWRSASSPLVPTGDLMVKLSHLLKQMGTALSI